MKKTGIFYGSSSGTTADVASRLAAVMGISPDDVHDVAVSTPDMVSAYEVLLLGTSTWGAGDLQDDWFSFLPKLASADLSGKTVAIFGCGDSAAFSDTFCDGMAQIFDDLQGKGCSFAGYVDSSDYTFDASVACRDGMFIGLPLDEQNEAGRTQSRIESWIQSLRSEGVL